MPSQLSFRAIRWCRLLLTMGIVTLRRASHSPGLESSSRLSLLAPGMTARRAAALRDGDHLGEGWISSRSVASSNDPAGGIGGGLHWVACRSGLTYERTLLSSYRDSSWQNSSNIQPSREEASGEKPLSSRWRRTVWPVMRIPCRCTYTVRSKSRRQSSGSSLLVFACCANARNSSIVRASITAGCLTVNAWLVTRIEPVGHKRMVAFSGRLMSVEEENSTNRHVGGGLVHEVHGLSDEDGLLRESYIANSRR
jgi:hypothetical protein